MAYNWQAGKSARAVAAQSDGRLPASKLAQRIRKYFPGVTAADIREVLSPSEWHHTSSHFNQTDHYDLRDLAEADARRQLRRLIAARKRYDALLKRAEAAGIDHVLTPEGEVWYKFHTPATRKLYVQSAAAYETECERIEATFAILKLN